MSDPSVDDISMSAFRSEMDGHVVVLIDTSTEGMEDKNGPILRVILNDDFENPIYDNTPGDLNEKEI